MKRSGGFVLLFALVTGLPVAAQAPPAAAKPFVVVGCLHRSEKNVFLVTDRRSGVQYEVTTHQTTPALTLGWQVGHELELRGSAATTPAGRRRLTANAVIEISSRCPQQPAAKR